MARLRCDRTLHSEAWASTAEAHAVLFAGHVMRVGGASRLRRETYNFGGDPLAANLYDSCRACIPCDANCDATINPFDIQPFVEVLGGGVGCSPCAADANVDGSVNPFDVNGFIDCLSKPLDMR